MGSQAPMAKTLLLSAGYEPLRILTWQRAVTLLALQKVEVVEEYDREIRSPSVAIMMPAVVRLLRMLRRVRRQVRFSRVNIYARDRYLCQYCGEKLPMGKLTFDHVVPRSRGGRTTWENIVTACGPCNRRKGCRTPKEAGMRMRNQPVRPSWVPLVPLLLNQERAPDAWRDYLYWAGELDSD